MDAGALNEPDPVRNAGGASQLVSTTLQNPLLIALPRWDFEDAEEHDDEWHSALDFDDVALSKLQGKAVMEQVWLRPQLREVVCRELCERQPRRDSQLNRVLHATRPLSCDGEHGLLGAGSVLRFQVDEHRRGERSQLNHLEALPQRRDVELAGLVDA